MKRLLGFLLLFLALGAHAQELVTATVTVVDIPNNGDSIVVNGNTRRWTNSPINGVAWIPTTNTLAATTTNLHLHIAATPFSALQLAYNSATSVRLQGSVIAVSFAGAWANVTYSTQLVTSLISVRVPVAGIPLATNRTFIGVELLKAINNYATNAFDNNAPALTNFLNLGPDFQYVDGPKQFNLISGNFLGLTNGTLDTVTITNAIISGTVITLTGGLWTGPILVSPIFTNAINYGNAFSSPGTGANSQQFGLGAEATGSSGTALGQSALARADVSTALGVEAYVATNAYAGIAIGSKSSAMGGRSMAIGSSAEAYETNGIAFGRSATSIHTNSYALGTDVTTTAADQIRLGNSGHTLSLPGDANFGQKLAIGTAEFADWPSGLNRGIAFLDGSTADAQATNSWVLYGVASEPFYRTGLASEGAEANNRLHNRGATVTGTGTAYSFTGSTARLDYSGQDPELALPSAGTYFITAVIEIVNGATANDEYHCKFRNFEDDLDITDSERVISNLPVSAIGQIHMQNVITVNDAKTIVVWGHNATAARGTSAAARTSLSYVRLY